MRLATSLPVAVLPVACCPLAVVCCCLLPFALNPATSYYRLAPRHTLTAHPCRGGQARDGAAISALR
jgi:hypothetical protein